MGQKAVVHAGMLVGSLVLAGSSLAQASCSCSGPSEPDPATEIAAKVVVAGGILAFVAYRHYKQRAPRL
jgi:hypothetical protein